MALPLRGVPQFGTALDGGDVTLTFDVPLQEGDTVFFHGGRGNSSDASAWGPITAGYVAVPTTPTQQPLNTVTAPKFGVWKKVMGPIPDTTVQGEGGGLAAHGVAYGCFVVPAGSLDPAIFDAVSIFTGEVTQVPKGSAITTATAGAWVVVFACNESADATRGTVAGYTIMAGGSANDTDDITIEVAWKEVAVPGVEDPPAWSLWSSALGGAITIAIKPMGADVTAPVLTAQSVTVDPAGMIPLVTTNEATGTGYMVIVPNGDAPSGPQIKLGQQSSGAAALAAQNQAVTAIGVQTFLPVTTMQPNTAYDCWFLHRDAAGNDSTPVKADFTTGLIRVTGVCIGQMMAHAIVKGELVGFHAATPELPAPASTLGLLMQPRNQSAAS